jgi:hypothetical protein
LLTIYPSYIPSDKSLGSLKSPSNEIVAKFYRELSRERSKERHRNNSSSKPFLDLTEDYKNRTLNYND